MSANNHATDSDLAEPRSGLTDAGLTNEQLSIPSAARMYDYYLGGHHNLAIDRQAAEEAISIYPEFPLIMQANRAFLRRVVVYLVEQGIERFLDIGSGIPTVGNVHQIAQQLNAAARVVYVDIDPVAVAHSAALLQGNNQAVIIEADLRQPETILDHPAVRDLLGVRQPVALILAFVLHFVIDDEQAVAVVRRLRDALPSGSYVVISHGTAERMPPDIFKQLVRLYRSTSQPVRIRSRHEIEPFFDGVELVEPGLVYVPLWRPEEAGDLLLDRPEVSGGFAGVALKA
ncbi:MAG: SAM-dependent methyltransferase [Chloroflexi bacterium]|nr:SAM-dependent methyltransferase [Chloroflexota bacterium]